MQRAVRAAAKRERPMIRLLEALKAFHHMRESGEVRFSDILVSQELEQAAAIVRLHVFKHAYRLRSQPCTHASGPQSNPPSH